MIPLAIGITIGLLLVILGIGEYMRLYLTAAGVKDALESAVISVVNDNYNEVYHGVREGYAAGYEPEGEGFSDSVDYGDVYGRLCFLLGLEEDGNGYSRFQDNGEKEFRISEVTVEVPNTMLAQPGGTYLADVRAKLEMPVCFAGKKLTDMTVQLYVRAAYTEKF